MLSLPAPLTPFFGREREIALVGASLRRPGVRLVTLVGPPGIGKTTLGLRVARGLAQRFDDGAAMIPLAGVRDADSVPSALGSALGLPEDRPGSAIEAVGDWLAKRHVLLMIDNFEQVVSAAPTLVELLERTSSATFLVTSREALAVRGEYVVPVPPLPFGESRSHNTPLGTTESVLGSPAAQLFCERARAADPDFRLTERNAPAVLAICQRLDGIPLALELAASRIRVLPLDSLLEAMDDIASMPSAALDALGEGGRDAPARHRTLSAAIDWSYRLVPEEERRLFRALGTFSGSWTLEALASLLAAMDGAPLAPLKAMETLAGRSLVFRAEDGRWSMLQPLRAYAAARLRDSGAEWSAAQEWHYRYALEQLAAGGGSNVSALEREADNLDGVLDWALAEGTAEQALRLGAALWPFWLARGRLFEGRRWLMRVLEVDLPHPAPLGAAGLRLAVLRGAAALARQQGDLKAASRHLEAERALLGAAADDPTTAAAFAACGVNLARIRVLEGRPQEARDLLDEALPELRRGGDPVQVGDGLLVEAMLWSLLGRPGEAVGSAEEAMEFQRASGDPALEGDGLATLALMLIEASKLKEAEEAARRSLLISEGADRPRGLAKATGALASVALAQGRFDEAEELVRSSLTLLDGLGDRIYGSYMLVNFGLAASGRGQYLRAARLAGAATGFCRRSGYAMVSLAVDRYRRLETAARSAMPDADYERAWSEGADLSVAAILEGVAEPADGTGSAGELLAAELTPRERQVLSEIARGISDAEVAERLSLSVRTVHSHLRSIYGKLGVANRTAAARQAIESGLVSAQPS